MKKIIVPILLLALLFSAVTPAMAAGSSSDVSAVYKTMGTAMVFMYIILGLMVAVSVAMTIWGVVSRTRNRRKTVNMLACCCYAVTAAVLVCSILCQIRYNHVGDALLENPTDSTQQQTGPQDQTNPNSDPTGPSVLPTEPLPPVITVPTFPGVPGKTDKSNPANWNVRWDIIQNESVVKEYKRPGNINFGDSKNYFSLPGVSGFRGGNYRDGASYGTVNMANEEISVVWERQISALRKSSIAGGGAWTGAGWTGQPLVVRWDENTRKIMNIVPEKKDKKDLVEVIYATLDGHIYFYDLEDGKYTRKPLNMGMAFKGSGALDPRGYPILYVGSGDQTSGGKVPRMFIINLIDCSIMYERGHKEPLAQRSWIAFDSSPLVDVNTDTLIWPGESGLLYTIKLNTNYDKDAGKLSIAPDKPVMVRYGTKLGTTIGFESSAIIVEHYIYVADNGGMMFCVDLNTMKLVWAQKVNDDTNATPVFQWEKDGRGYLYTATSMEFAEGKVYVHKIDAMTGEFVWEKVFNNVFFNKNVSGGVLSSPVLGKKGTNMEGLIIYPIARVGGAYSGILVALDTDTGRIVWEQSMRSYTWSSPVAVYTDDGKGYMIMCDSAGNVQLMDGKTGKMIKKINIGSNVEASPVVFNNMLVVGTRGQKVCGIRIG